MGISEIIAAIGAVGISSIILALVKLLQFFKDSSKDKVDSILSRVDEDNKRWHSKYEDTLTELELKEIELDESRMLNYKLRVELIMSGIPESRIKEIEDEVKK